MLWGDRERGVCVGHRSLGRSFPGSSCPRLQIRLMTCACLDAGTQHEHQRGVRRRGGTSARYALIRYMISFDIFSYPFALHLPPPLSSRRRYSGSGLSRRPGLRALRGCAQPARGCGGGTDAASLRHTRHRPPPLLRPLEAIVRTLCLQCMERMGHGWLGVIHVPGWACRSPF